MKKEMTIMLLTIMVFACTSQHDKSRKEKEKFEFSTRVINIGKNPKHFIQCNNFIVALNNEKITILNNKLNIKDSATRALDSLIVYDPFIHDKHVLLLTYTGMKELNSDYLLCKSDYPLLRANLQWQYLYDDENYHVTNSNEAVSFYNKKNKKDFVLSSPHPFQVFKLNNSYYVVNNVFDACIYQIINNPDSLSEVKNRDTIMPYFQNTKTGNSGPVFIKGAKTFFESNIDTSKAYLKSFLSFTYKGDIYSIMTSDKAVFLYKISDHEFEIIDTLIHHPLHAGFMYATSYNNRYLGHFDHGNPQDGAFTIDSNKIVLYLFNQKN